MKRLSAIVMALFAACSAGAHAQVGSAWITEKHPRHNFSYLRPPVQKVLPAGVFDFVDLLSDEQEPLIANIVLCYIPSQVITIETSRSWQGLDTSQALYAMEQVYKARVCWEVRTMPIIPRRIAVTADKENRRVLIVEVSVPWTQQRFYTGTYVF